MMPEFTSVPPIFFDHMGNFNDEFSFFVLLAGLKGMLLYTTHKQYYYYQCTSVPTSAFSVGTST